MKGGGNMPGIIPPIIIIGCGDGRIFIMLGFIMFGMMGVFVAPLALESIAFVVAPSVEAASVAVVTFG